ncbi:MAG: hypothetical protein KAH21_12615, partial [Spirochaetaceae bacterium]|nr:hypothetical protein [Spirochaetaceae bacterium]
MINQLKITILPEGNVSDTAKGTRVIDLINGDFPVVAVKICNQYASLQDSVDVDCSIEPVSIYSTAGMRIYRNS